MTLFKDGDQHYLICLMARCRDGLCFTYVIVIYYFWDVSYLMMGETIIAPVALVYVDRCLDL